MPVAGKYLRLQPPSSAASPLADVMFSGSLHPTSCAPTRTRIVKIKKTQLKTTTINGGSKTVIKTTTKTVLVPPNNKKGNRLLRPENKA